MVVYSCDFPNVKYAVGGNSASEEGDYCSMRELSGIGLTVVFLGVVVLVYGNRTR
jgi:hypothetical protein